MIALHGVYRAVVVSNSDPQSAGRLVLKVPQLFGDSPTGWTRPCFSPGTWTLPRNGDVVWVAFQGGDPNYPIWIGTPKLTSVPTFPAGTFGTPGNSAPGDIASPGVSPLLPRLDHRHGREAAPTAWIAPAFLNGWVDAGVPRVAVGYRMVGTIVYLRGTIQTGTMNTTAFTLNSGFWPVAEQTFVTSANHALGDFRIDASGNVIPVTGSNVLFRLDGASFAVV